MVPSAMGQGKEDEKKFLLVKRTRRTKPREKHSQAPSASRKPREETPSRRKRAPLHQTLPDGTVAGLGLAMGFSGVDFTVNLTGTASQWRRALPVRLA